MILYVDSQYASPWAMSVFVALREKRFCRSKPEVVAWADEI